MTLEAFAYSYGGHGHNERNEVQRRSSSVGAVSSQKRDLGNLFVRCLWCRLDCEGNRRCHASTIFGQIRRNNLMPYTQRRFAQLCENYEVGKPGRTSRTRFVELLPKFIIELPVHLRVTEPVTMTVTQPLTRVRVTVRHMLRHSLRHIESGVLG